MTEQNKKLNGIETSLQIAQDLADHTGMTIGEAANFVVGYQTTLLLERMMESSGKAGFNWAEVFGN